VHFDETFATPPSDDWLFEDEGVADQGYEPRSWMWRGDPPEGADGGAMYAASDPNAEDCGFPTQAGRVSLTTPEVTLPHDVRSPMLLLDHYVATAPYPWSFGDGGNLKISVNDGDFLLVDSAAFEFNTYSGTLVESDQDMGSSPNPLAGEPAFFGVNDGFFHGSWGQSQVDISDLAGPGDRIRFRFDFGTDGCIAIDGWYLDRVRVVSVSPVRQGDGRAP
jgi:hypothetical protein